MIPAPRFSATTQSVFVLGILSAALFFGDVAWAQVLLMAIVLQSRSELRFERLSLMACSLIWLAMFRWMFVRQLFFPYTLHLAVCVVLCGSDFDKWRGYIKGMIVVAVFIAIRFLQGATNRILSIELIVAAVILASAIGFYQLTPKNAASRAIVVVLSSLAAVAGLAI